MLINGKYLPLWPLAAEKLNAGREVLFTGLGCDIAALYSYLKANHIDASKLYTLDLICFGPAIPEIHRQYIDSLEKKYHSRMKSFTVRHKLTGWIPRYIRAEFEDGRAYITHFYDSDYGKAFGLYTREHCYSCRFKGINHQADITVGDYWGLTPKMPGWNVDGVSIFLVRTDKGQELISRIDPQEFTVEPADVNFALEHNPMYSESRKKPQDYRKFCDDLKIYGLHKAIVNHFGFADYYLRPIKAHVKKYIPAPIWQMLKKIFRRK